MPEDIYGDYYGDYGDYGSDAYGEPVGPLEAVYSAPATEYPPLDLSGWDIEAFKALHNNPTGQANAEAINKYIADQAAQGKEVVSLNPYQGSGLDAINANIWNSYNQFDPNKPGATTGEVFRFDIGKNENTAPAVLSEGKTYVLTDAKGEQVLGTASTPEEMRALVQKANDKAYGWNIYEGTPEGGFVKGTELFGESDPRASGLMGALVNIGLPLALSFVPGVGWVGSAALAGAGSTAAGLMTGKTLGDALKSGAITAGTAGLLKGTGLDQTIGNALSDVPVVGDAMRSVGNALAPSAPSSAAANAIANEAANEIVVNAARNLAPSIVSGGLSSAAASLIPNIVTNPATGELSLVRQPEAAPTEPTGGLDVLAPEDIVVTAGRTPLDLPGVIAPAVSTVVTNPATGELAVKSQELTQDQRQPEVQEEAASPNEIVVTGKTTPLDVSGALSSAVSNLLPPVSVDPVTGEIAANEDIVVEKRKPETEFPATGPLTTVADNVVSTEPPAAPTEDIVVEKRKPETELPATGPLTTVADNVVSTEPPAAPTEDIVVEKRKPETELPVVTPPPIGEAPKGTLENEFDETFAEEDKGGLSTLDKIRLAAAALGALGGATAGGSKGATMPGGFGLDPSFSKQLPIPGVGGAFAVGGLGPNTLPGIGGVVPPGGDYTKFGMGNATRAVPTAIPQYGGVNPPGFNTQTWEWLGPQSAPAKNIIDQLSVLPTSAAPVAAEEPVKKAMGGYAVGGPGDGRSDEIPAMLSDGEYVIDAETVALLGNGSNKAGAKQLDKFRANIRKHKGRELARGKFSVKAKEPSAYLSGGR